MNLLNDRNPTMCFFFVSWTIKHKCWETKRILPTANCFFLSSSSKLFPKTKLKSKNRIDHALVCVFVYCRWENHLWNKNHIRSSLLCVCVYEYASQSQFFNLLPVVRFINFNQIIGIRTCVFCSCDRRKKRSESSDHIHAHEHSKCLNDCVVCSLVTVRTADNNNNIF